MHEKNQPPAQPPMQQRYAPIQQPMPMPPVQACRRSHMPIPKHPCFSPDMTGGAGAYTWMYPDIYYKIQPHVTDGVRRNGHERLDDAHEENDGVHVRPHI